MKKLKIYIFLFIYLLGSLGVLINFHYCGGNLVAVALFHVNEDNCCGEEEEKTKHCCDDKYVLVDTDDSESMSSFVLPANKWVLLIGTQYAEKGVPNKYHVFANNYFIPFNHAPPNGVLDPLYLKNNVLRI